MLNPSHVLENSRIFNSILKVKFKRCKTYTLILCESNRQKCSKTG